MAKDNMTIRIEPELKAQAAALFKTFGMDLSTATRIFYQEALRCHGLPFEVKTDESWAETLYLLKSPKNAKRLFDSIAALEKGDVIKKDLESLVNDEA